MRNIENFYNFNESVRNLFEYDVQIKRKYMDQVWDILQDAYSGQGGLIANGFGTPEEMLNIPFWKLDIIDNKVNAVFMYKFIQVNNVYIRKLIAIGISRDNVDVSRLKLKNMMKREFNRSIFEVSLLLENYIIRNFPDEYKKYIFTVEQVKSILKGKEIIPIDEFRYERLIGNTYTKKVMIGTIKEKY